MTVEQQIKQDEGLRLKPYRCTAGKITIGYGFNLDAGISQEIANMLFDCSYQQARNGAIKIMADYDILPNQKLWDILTQMVFQLGSHGVRGFKRMIEALQKNDYKAAAAEMLDSKWHKDTPTRCERMAAEMSKI